MLKNEKLKKERIQNRRGRIWKRKKIKKCKQNREKANKIEQKTRKCGKKLKKEDNDQENMEINQPMRLDCEASWC